MMLDPFLVFEHRRVRLRAEQIPASPFLPCSPFIRFIFYPVYIITGFLFISGFVP